MRLTHQGPESTSSKGRSTASRLAKSACVAMALYLSYLFLLGPFFGLWLSGKFRCSEAVRVVILAPAQPLLMVQAGHRLFEIYVGWCWQATSGSQAQ